MFLFRWKALYENAYKGLHKSTENHWNFLIVNVNFFIIFNFFVRRYTIFSRMNIIFLHDTGNVIFKCILAGEDHACFFDRRVISSL